MAAGAKARKFVPGHLTLTHAGRPTPGARATSGPASARVNPRKRPSGSRPRLPSAASERRGQRWEGSGDSAGRAQGTAWGRRGDGVGYAGDSVGALRSGPGRGWPRPWSLPCPQVTLTALPGAAKAVLAWGRAVGRAWRGTERSLLARRWSSCQTETRTATGPRSA